MLMMFEWSKHQLLEPTNEFKAVLYKFVHIECENWFLAWLVLILSYRPITYDIYNMLDTNLLKVFH